jgi:hypothetical protein
MGMMFSLFLVFSLLRYVSNSPSLPAVPLDPYYVEIDVGEDRVLRLSNRGLSQPEKEFETRLEIPPDAGFEMDFALPQQHLSTVLLRFFIFYFRFSSNE